MVLLAGGQSLNWKEMKKEKKKKDKTRKEKKA